jgi:flagellar hook-basal body complex protein FliE
MLEADQSIENFVTGKDQDIHHTMVSMEKASVSFELVLQIRNKMMAAYDEIRKMSI